MRAFVDLLLRFGPENDHSSSPPFRSNSLTRTTAFQAPAFQLLIDSPGDPATPTLLQMAEAGHWRAWMVGELYASTAPSREPACPPVQRFVEGLAAGREDAASLNGHFFLLAWNGAERRWHAWTDRFGTLHAYWCHQGARAAIGTFSPAVASIASARQLDLEALTGFLSFGFFPADRTQFRDVRILGPATHAVFDENGERLHQERTWSWRHTPEQAPPYDAALEELHHLLTAVLGAQMGAGRVALPISGGLDSRTTVALVSGREGDPIRGNLWAYSYGYTPNSIETRIAREAASTRSLQLASFTVGPYLFQDIDRVVASVEGFQDITQPRQAAVVDNMGRHADSVIAAHWGDVWMDDSGLLDLANADEESIVEHAVHKFQKRGRAWLLEAFLPVRSGQIDPECLQREFVQSALHELQGIEDPDFRVKALKTDHWSFRWTIASLRTFQMAAFPRLPFYDTALTDFFCRLPSAWMRGRQFQIDYLKRFAPDLARITSQSTGRSLFDGDGPDTLALPRRVALGIWRRLTPRPPAQNWEVQFLNPSGRAGLEEWLLRPGLRLHELFPRAEVQDLLTAFYSEPRRQHRGYAVSMLLTLSTWLERYA